jgi:hypothetical protein
MPSIPTGYFHQGNKACGQKSTGNSEIQQVKKQTQGPSDRDPGGRDSQCKTGPKISNSIKCNHYSKSISNHQKPIYSKPSNTLPASIPQGALCKIITHGYNLTSDLDASDAIKLKGTKGAHSSISNPSNSRSKSEFLPVVSTPADVHTGSMERTRNSPLGLLTCCE